MLPWFLGRRSVSEPAIPPHLVCVIGRWVCGLASPISLIALFGFSNLLLLITPIIILHRGYTVQAHSGNIVTLVPCMPSACFSERGTVCSLIFTSSVPADVVCQGISLEFHTLWRLMSGLLDTLAFFVLIVPSCDGDCLFLVVPTLPMVGVQSFGF